jgi:hypothetical protein
MHLGSLLPTAKTLLAIVMALLAFWGLGAERLHAIGLPKPSRKLIIIGLVATTVIQVAVTWFEYGDAEEARTALLTDVRRGLYPMDGTIDFGIELNSKAVEAMQAGSIISELLKDKCPGDDKRVLCVTSNSKTDPLDPNQDIVSFGSPLYPTRSSKLFQGTMSLTAELILSKTRQPDRNHGAPLYSKKLLDGFLDPDFVEEHILFILNRDRKTLVIFAEDIPVTMHGYSIADISGRALGLTVSFRELDDDDESELTVAHLSTDFAHNKNVRLGDAAFHVERLGPGRIWLNIPQIDRWPVAFPYKANIASNFGKGRIMVRHAYLVTDLTAKP